MRNFAHMNIETTRLPRTIIRIGRQSLAFALPEQQALDASEKKVPSKVHYEPYTVKSGMSMAANLRRAFRESVILSHPNNRVQVLIDSPVLLVPMEEYEEADNQELYNHTFTGHENDIVMSHVMPDLNSVALFAINKDVRMVITDHFNDVRIMPLQVPVWQHLHHRSFSGPAKKLYVYFHDGQLNVFCFTKNRFRFQNTFKATSHADSTYYILYTWQQVAMDQHKDELYIVGNYEQSEELRTELKQYVQNVFAINPSSEFNRAPITQIPHITYDLICLCE